MAGEFAEEAKSTLELTAPPAALPARHPWRAKLFGHGGSGLLRKGGSRPKLAKQGGMSTRDLWFGLIEEESKHHDDYVRLGPKRRRFPARQHVDCPVLDPHADWRMAFDSAVCVAASRDDVREMWGGNTTRHRDRRAR